MQPLRIETTVAEVASELRRQGIGPDERVTLTIAPPPVMSSSGARAAVAAVVAVAAGGLTDEEIGRLIEQAQLEIDEDDA